MRGGEKEKRIRRSRRKTGRGGRGEMSRKVNRWRRRGGEEKKI